VVTGGKGTGYEKPLEQRSKGRARLREFFVFIYGGCECIVKRTNYYDGK